MLSDILLYSQRGVCSETKVFEFAVLTRNNLPTYGTIPILLQQKDLVGGVRKIVILLLTFSTIYADVG